MNEQLDINALRAQLGLDNISDALKALNETQKAQKEAEERAEREKAEQARIKALIDGATGDTKKALEEANETIKALEGKLAQSGEAFAKALEQMQDQVKAQSNEIQQLVAARNGSPALNVGALRFAKAEDAIQEVENVVFLSYLTEKGLFETKYGQAHQKAVNGSSSIQVSSEDYETTFSTNLLRDIQKMLVVGNLFTELPMNSKTLTMLVDPEAGTASWVDNSTFGTDDTVGDEIKVALGEMTFTTFKLAAKIFMTDETEEDAVLPLLPILRRHLIESHAKAIENAFMNGTGVGVPTGLLKYAQTDGRAVATAAKADGTVKVTAAEISALRRKMGRYGFNVSKLTLIVSLDAYYDLLEDPEWQDVNQVGEGSSVKLQGQVGRIYGMPVVVSEWFPAKAVDKEYAVIVYTDNFVVPRQRQLTVERERQAGKQRDAYYATQRLNLQRMFANGVVSAKYAAA
ncbi:major capsid protein [Aeromonas phage vB_AdhS_TS3]|nr:major capsid protein [Aeromonas phage vB_AdhS_TS3]